MNYLPIIVTRRRPRNLWRVSYWVCCWSCEFRLGPYWSQRDADLQRKAVELGEEIAEPFECPPPSTPAASSARSDRCGSISVPRPPASLFSEHSALFPGLVSKLTKPLSLFAQMHRVSSSRRARRVGFVTTGIRTRSPSPVPNRVLGSHRR